MLLLVGGLILSEGELGGIDGCPVYIAACACRVKCQPLHGARAALEALRASA